eukprot:5962646-Heterocapsa_arctica.AAC.1
MHRYRLNAVFNAPDFGDILSRQRISHPFEWFSSKLSEPGCPKRACVHDVDVLDPCMVYVGRSPYPRLNLRASKWGNPFRVRDFGRRLAITKFAEFLKGNPLMPDLPELLGKTLLCHCKPHQACHADVLISELFPER